MSKDNFDFGSESAVSAIHVMAPKSEAFFSVKGPTACWAKFCKNPFTPTNCSASFRGKRSGPSSHCCRIWATTNNRKEIVLGDGAKRKRLVLVKNTQEQKRAEETRKQLIQTMENIYWNPVMIR